MVDCEGDYFGAVWKPCLENHALHYRVCACWTKLQMFPSWCSWWLQIDTKYLIKRKEGVENTSRFQGPVQEWHKDNLVTIPSAHVKSQNFVRSFRNWLRARQFSCLHYQSKKWNNAGQCWRPNKGVRVVLDNGRNGRQGDCKWKVIRQYLGKKRYVLDLKIY